MDHLYGNRKVLLGLGGIKYKKKERQKREDKEVEFKKIFFD